MSFPVQYRTITSLIRGWIFRGPVYVQLAVTPRCNLNCRMCQVVKTWKGEPELTLQQMERIAATLMKLGVGYIVLTGGEPFLRKDLPQIVKLFSERGFDVRLQTNGTLTSHKLADRLIENGLRHISVSLNSLDPKIEDEFSSGRNVWKKVMNTLGIFSEKLPTRGSMVVLNSVVLPHTIDEIPSLAEFARRAGFYNSFIPVHIATDQSGLNYRSHQSELSFQADQYTQIDRGYEELIELKNKGYPVFGSRRFLRESAEFLKTGKTSWRCPIPDLFFEVAPDGRYSPCSEFTTRYSVLNPDFVERYSSPQFKKEIRKYAQACPGCMYACWPEVTYMCTSPRVFLERIGEFFRLLCFRRPRYSPVELMEIAASCRSFR